MTEPLTLDDEATHPARGFRAFVVIHVEGVEGSRVLELPDRVEVTLGRSRGATVTVDDERISRVHARLCRVGEEIEIEDLGSRNGTRVNGDRIEGARRVIAGDEIAVGPIRAIVGMASRLRTRRAIADGVAGELRLVAEVYRSVAYHRPLTLALVRVRAGDDAGIEAIARSLRAMDLVVEDAGDDYLVILPELGRADGRATVERWPGLASYAIVQCPEDGTTVDALIGQLRSWLRAGLAPIDTPPPVIEPLAIDPAMMRIYAMVERIADSHLTVLILGETGVGKELVAEAIHRRSARRDMPLVKLNCAALPETLLESALFGHERGAFTGAERRTAGFFEASHGGTLFLDEIGEMSVALQAKLLRVLESRNVTRVGGTTAIETDVRLLAATHRDLEAEVRAQRFRHDLLFRIGGFTLVVPPLRDRTMEIVPLAEHFLRLAAREQGRQTPTLTDDARVALTGYAWPGNVRELRNAIERALVLCTDTISALELPDKLRDQAQRTLPLGVGVRGHLAEVERAAIIAALEAADGNQTQAALALGVSRRALIYKLERFGLKPLPRSLRPP